MPVCSVDSVVASLDPDSMVFTEIADLPATEDFGGGTAAIFVDDELWIGTFRGDRLAVLRGVPK